MTRNPTDLHLGKRLKHARTVAGMTQGELGAKLCLSAQQIQKYESGQNRVSVSRLLVIGRILNLDIYDLMNDLSQYDSHSSIKHSTQVAPASRKKMQLLHAINSIDREVDIELLMKLAHRFAQPLNEISA